MTDLYKEAARILQRANLKAGSLKTLVYSSTYRNLRQLFALVSECVKHQSLLRDILARCGPDLLNEEIIDNDHDLAVILLYELLVGNGFGRAGSIRKMMRNHKAEIKAAYDGLLKEKNAASLSDILKGSSKEMKSLPRYARVNLIKSSVDEARRRLCEDGWEFVGKLSIERFQEDIASFSESQFALDPLLNDVLVFPVNTDLHDYLLVTDGTLVLQDKASCVPAHVLNPDPGSVVLDCCAAPGNKTSHLASLMGDQGRIIALDRDSKRMSTMNSLIQRSGASCVETIVQDFLTLSPKSEEVTDIKFILVDPSCSGSGMPGSRISSTDRETNPQRLQALKRFQISLLKHALRFPNVQRVVYSTCSIHKQENEEVVEEVMSHVEKYFQFQSVFPDWSDSRGLEEFPNHEKFLRLSSEKNLTAGFFVACFERRKSSEPSCEKEKEIGTDQGGGENGDTFGDNERCDAKVDKIKRKRHLENTTKVAEWIENEGNENEENICVEGVEGKTLVTEPQQSRPKRKRKREKEESNEIVTHSDVSQSLIDDSEEGVRKKEKRKKKHKRDKDKNEAENSESVADEISISVNLQNASEKKRKKTKKKDKDENLEVVETPAKKKKKLTI